MAQQTQEQQQQSLSRAQARKRSMIKRWVIFIGGILSFAAAAVVGFWSSGNVSLGIWASVLTWLLIFCGLALTLWGMLFPLQPIESPQSGSAMVPISLFITATTNNDDYRATTAKQQTLAAPIDTNQPPNVPPSDGQKPMVATAQNHLDPIFLPNARLTDPNDFYGRKLERTQLIRATRNHTSTSLVGPRRIGKTWMMSYLRLIAPTELGPNYYISDLDATSPLCTSVADFTRIALEALGYDTALLGHSKIGLDALARHVEAMRMQHQVPVLCINEFEGFNDRQEFGEKFFSGLRSMTQNGLVLVTASRKSLRDVLIDISDKTSPFFNVFYSMPLRPFSAQEAEEFFKAKGFTEEERTRLLKYVSVYSSQGEEQWPPFRLQLAGQQLLDDKTSASTDPDHYRPNDLRYWQDFKKRLEEHYQAVVG